ncbi:hypothetical protein ZHAS_00008697 [Anopheles sinensis]|uniref:Uncharacterized protein n=1 Tax=Anopheles sinensis TaxID=74873 RepID=A0A084VT55_ANOSI|nr:hypothetical protein ZHAS_00008697 [Anopheles sinensis]
MQFRLWWPTGISIASASTRVCVLENAICPAECDLCHGQPKENPKTGRNNKRERAELIKEQ